MRRSYGLIPLLALVGCQRYSLWVSRSRRRSRQRPAAGRRRIHRPSTAFEFVGALEWMGGRRRTARSLHTVRRWRHVDAAVLGHYGVAHRRQLRRSCTGWAVGYGGTILHTTDGGAHVGASDCRGPPTTWTAVMFRRRPSMVGRSENRRRHFAHLRRWRDLDAAGSRRAPAYLSSVSFVDESDRLGC